MDLGMEISIFLVYTAGMFILYFFGRLFFVPIKHMLKLILNGLIGGIVLLILNFIAEPLGIFLPLNPLTALAAGILGIPGIAAVLLYFNFF